ncbi:SusC/RagA family TonB-linked outer membrane protein [Parabacteroides sp. FAFU027]|uniref:SusC/RagA family TonB-linked outer membrane protein n=1 Tax=Parabacteroides sp. FAFU027 TaxID=2922715 RepID=UPI001FAEF08C|nr:TonB-dependent receptor [Parabacteroides sp. FAFU027]
MKRKIKEFVNVAFLMAFLLASCIQAMAANAQNSRKIKGVVVSATDGQPLIGATVLVKGTKEGTITDLDGKFNVTAGDNAVLQVSYVGFISQSVSVGNQSSLKISLKESAKTIDEVVVVGYGVQKKKLVTGATVQVKGEDLQKLNTTNALQAMQGQMAGVNITTTSGQPGGGIKVNIRGVGTVGNSGPLYVVDGVITGDITYLNNSDIAAVDVLKDAASCAIYGINGANGVVLITTKGGDSVAKKGGQVSFDAYYGIQNIARKLPLLNAREYATMQNEQAINSGLSPYFNQSQIAALGNGTNWLDQVLSKDVPTQNYNLAANGGDASSKYSLGLSYTQQGGIIGGTKLSNYERYNFRSNAEHKMYDGALKVGEHMTFSFNNKSGISDGGIYNTSFRSALTTTPLLAMYGPDGKYLDSRKSTVYNGGPWLNSEANPYALMQYNNQNNTKSQTLVGDVYAELEPVKNLKIKSTFGLNYNSSANHSYTPVYDYLSIYAFNKYEKIFQGSSQNYTYNWDNTINYLFKINEHKFDVLAGSSIRKSQGSWMNGSNTGTTLFGDFNHGYLSTSQITGYSQSGSIVEDPQGATETDLQYQTRLANNRQLLTHGISAGGNANALYAQASFFGRVNYNYKETYMASAVLRADGSTHFAKGHQWGYFPSLSAGWVISNESFMESTKDAMDFLKLRASWGSNGNDAITEFNYLSLMQLENAQYNFGNDNTTLTPGAYPRTIGVEKTKWETSYQTNIGADARFLNSKLNVSLDVYNKTTKDWLIARPLPATVGVPVNPFINGGDVTNKGVELQLSYNDKLGADFAYSITGSYAYNVNKVNNIPNAEGIIHGGGNSLYVNAPEVFRAEEGQPIGYFWGYKTAGIFQNEAEVQSYKSNGKVLQPSASPGDLKYVDTNGDGKITADDKVNIGDPNPHHIFGFTVACNYKGFDLSVTANGVAGNKIAQAYRDGGSRFGNWTTDILSRWHGEGTSNTTPRLTTDNKNWSDFSDLYVHDGSYLRISNVTLGYDVAKNLKLKNLSQFRLYVAAQNLFTFTKYSGLDPEVGHSEGDATGVYSFGQGIDNGSYPRPRIFLVGVNIKF